MGGDAFIRNARQLDERDGFAFHEGQVDLSHKGVPGIGGNDRTAIILPADSAGLAAELMSRAAIFERDGYYSTSGWKRAEEGVRIEYTEGSELEPTHPLVEQAQKEASEKSSMWARE